MVKASFSFPLAYLITACAVWLVPFFYTGWTGRSLSFLPKSVTFQHSAAGLFTKRSTLWWDHHLEGQKADGSREEIPERQVFPMGAFGFRTRYDRILIESGRSPLAGAVRLRLAEHVRRKTGGGKCPYTAIRLVRTLWTVGAPDMIYPIGEWSPPPVTEITAPQARQLLGTYVSKGDHLVEVVRKGPATIASEPKVPTEMKMAVPRATALTPVKRLPKTRRFVLPPVPLPGTSRGILTPGVPVVRKPVPAVSTAPSPDSSGPPATPPPSFLR